jgi:hypothetical protein
MPLKRKQHWATRAYHHFLPSRAKMPFEWGKHDCALFAADGIEAITGVDIAAEFRGQYSDEAGAWKAIQTITGGETVEDAAAWCAARHGLAELPLPLFAQRGDLCIVEDSGRLIAGLVHLSGRHIVAAGEDGLHRLPITAIKRAWRV